MKFRSKPTIIEAEQFSSDSRSPLPFAIRRACQLDASRGWYVNTAHNQRVYLTHGDWVIPEPDGIHFYPVKPDIFAAKYERVD